MSNCKTTINIGGIYELVDYDTKPITNCINCGGNEIEHNTCSHCGTKYN